MITDQRTRFKFILGSYMLNAYSTMCTSFVIDKLICLSSYACVRSRSFYNAAISYMSALEVLKEPSRVFLKVIFFIRPTLSPLKLQRVYFGALEHSCGHIFSWEDSSSSSLLCFGATLVLCYTIQAIVVKNCQ